MDFSTILLMILPMVFAITIHEAAHGYVARHYGDNTAAQLGRLSLNPAKHIDPVGTVLVPLVMFAVSAGIGGGFIFGWAKPVPVDVRNFRNRRMGMRMVALAGPMSNFVMMLLWGLVALIAFYLPGMFHRPLSLMAQYGIMFNAFLGVLNMLPILPLDGGRFVDTFLPPKASMQFQKIEPYGTWIILFLLISGLLMKILVPIATMLMGLTYTLIGFFV